MTKPGPFRYRFSKVLAAAASHAAACVTLAAADVRDGSAQPLSAGATYTADYFYNASGGVRRGGALLHNLDLQAALEGTEEIGLPGFQAHLYLLATGGGSISAFAGEAQAVSSIEAPAAVRLYELWVQQDLHADLSVRLGLYDLNSEFYASEAGGLFVNSSHGIGPEFASSGVSGPSIFPVTSLTARVRWAPGPLRLQLAVLDAVPGHVADERRFVHADLSRSEGALVVGEAGWAQAGGARLSAGAWTYTAHFPDAVDEDSRSRPSGAYALAEGRIRGDERSGRVLVGFGRLGYANARVHPMHWSWSAGLVQSGPVASRPSDQAGVAITVGAHSSRYLRLQSDLGEPLRRTETVVELTYSLQAADAIRIQPDVQYILNPGMSTSLRNALLIGARVELALRTSDR